MEREIYLTADGAAKLQAELEELKGPKRDEMAKRLRSAIQMGDLSENADYHKAKEDQSFMERQDSGAGVSPEECHDR